MEKALNWKGNPKYWLFNPTSITDAGLYILFEQKFWRGFLRFNYQ